ncbi:MAG: hypothetical protein DMF63_09980 [Acidobacteria bacterium]|nr:MAG: hypothetical protein DMF63_09980 [Acidobacteriota bacterium]
MIRSISIFAIVILYLGALSAFGQGKPAWINDIETAIKQKEPTFVIGDRRITENLSAFSERLVLNKGGVTGLVDITTYTVLSNPEETFDGLVEIENNVHANVKGTKIADLGDAAYIWAGKNADNFATINFKKGKTFVRISLPGKATALRFAKLIESHIP